MSDQDSLTASQEAVERTESAPEGTSGNQPETRDETFTNFRLQDVPEEYREHVEKAYNQLRSDYSRKTGELAETRKGLGTLAERREDAEVGLRLISGLRSEEQRAATLKQLISEVGEDVVLEALGVELEGSDNPDDTEDTHDPRVDRLIEEREQEKAAQAAEAERARLEQLEKDIDEQIDSVAKDRSVELSETARKFTWSRLLDPDDEDETPQVDRTLNELLSLRDEWIKEYRNTKRDPGAPPVSGSSPSPSQDLSDPKQRRAAALAAVNRVFDS